MAKVLLTYADLDYDEVVKMVSAIKSDEHEILNSQLDNNLKINKSAKKEL